MRSSWQRANALGGRVALVGLCGMASVALAQSGAAGSKAPGCTPVSGTGATATQGDGTSAGCKAGEHVPSVSEQFPFPGEAAAPAGGSGKRPDGKAVKDQFPYPGETPVAAPKAGAAGDRFPYPGETGSSSSTEGSSSSSSSSSSGADGEGKPAFKDEGSEGEAQPQHRRRLRPPAQKTLSDTERVEEDLTVAHFYQQSGNSMGAYLRAKDAVKLDPGSADTHLALATAAEKLGKRDEAIAEYTAALTAEPDGDGAKGAQKALDRLKR